MDNRQDLRDKLLRADGIDPEDVSNAEWEWFRDALTPKELGRGLQGSVVRRRIARLAVAAAILMAVATGVYFLDGGTSRVWAEVLDKVRNTKSFQCRQTMERIRITADGQKDVTTTETITYASEEYGLLLETHLGGELTGRTYWLFDRNEVVAIGYVTKECHRQRSRQTREDFAEEMDPRRWLIRALEGQYSKLGRKTVNGRTLAGIESHDTKVLSLSPQGFDEYVLRLWIDMETKLPVRAEIEYAATVDGLTMKSSFVADQFQWDLELPADLFTPHIPDGYTVWTDRLDEAASIHSLRLFAESAGGKYPSKLDQWTMQQEIGGFEQAPSASKARQMASGEYRHDTVWDALGFYRMLVEDGHEVAYYGDRVTPADANLVLMHWNVSDTERRVVWGDLRIETISVGRLARHFSEARQAAPLVDLLKTAPYETRQLIAGYLGMIADESAIVPLQKYSEQWSGPDDENPFEKAIDEIWRRQQRSDSATAATPLVKGRLVYANGRPANRGMIHIGNATSWADSTGYFAMAAPAGDLHDYHLCCAFGPARHTGRAFFWSPAQAEKSLTVVLDFLYTVRGRVVDPSGAPLRQANVKLVSRPEVVTDDFWTFPNRARIDAEGYFVFDDVPVGVPLELRAEIPGLPGSQRRITIGELAPDQSYDMADVVLSSSAERNLSQEK